MIVTTRGAVVMPAKCPICAELLDTDGDPFSDPQPMFNCRRCGRVMLLVGAYARFRDLYRSGEFDPEKDREAADALSHYIRRTHPVDDGRYFAIRTDRVEELVKTCRLSFPMERADNLILFLGTTLNAGLDPASPVFIEFVSKRYRDEWAGLGSRGGS